MHKRALGAAAVTGVAALALSACGGSSPTTPSNTGAAGTSKADDAPATPETPSGTAAPVRDANVDLVIWTDADRSKAVQKYADQFAAENGVHRSRSRSPPTPAPSSRTRPRSARARTSSSAPTTGSASSSRTRRSPRSTSRPTWRRKFLPTAIAATKFNGQSYGVPYAVENIGLMYNKDLVPNAPKTMDELVATGEKLVKEGKAKQVLSQFVSKVGNAYFAYPYLSAFPDGGIFATKPNGDYDPNKVIVNSAGSVKGGEVLAELGKMKVLSTNVDDTNQDALFDTKAAPFMISGPWSVAKAKEAGINYGIAPLPSLTGGGAMQPFLGVQMFYVSSKAKNAALAQEFVTNYIPRKDVQLALFEVGKRPPALKEAYDQVAASDPDVKAWYEAGVERQADAEHPGDELGLGPLRPGDRGHHRRQGGCQGASRRCCQGDRGQHRQGLSSLGSTGVPGSAAVADPGTPATPARARATRELLAGSPSCIYGNGAGPAQKDVSHDQAPRARDQVGSHRRDDGRHPVDRHQARRRQATRWPSFSPDSSGWGSSPSTRRAGPCP